MNKYYVFKDNKLVHTIESKWAEWGFSDKKMYPTDCYIYDEDNKEWRVKKTRAYSRPVQNKHVPKELKTILLLMGVN